MIHRLFFLLLASLVCHPVSAGITVKMYQESKSAGPDIKRVTVAYISGVGGAYSWANSELEHEGKQPMYCPPRTLALHSDLLVELVDKEIANFPYRPDFTVEMAVLFALKRKFPCR